jgi:hypothetical protein
MDSRFPACLSIQSVIGGQLLHGTNRPIGRRGRSSDVQRYRSALKPIDGNDLRHHLAG